MSSTPGLTRDYVISVIDYDPVGGTMIWRERTPEMEPSIRSRNTFNAAYKGCSVGSTSTASKDIRVSLGCKTYSLRSLAYLIMTGSLPEGRTCTINGIKDDLRWSNLATMAELKQAKKEGVILAKAQADSEINRTPYPGVVWSGQLERFMAIIYFGFAMMVVGSFRTAEAATEARDARMMEMGL